MNIFNILNLCFAFPDINEVNEIIDELNSNQCGPQDIIYPSGYIDPNTSDYFEHKILKSISYHYCTFTKYHPWATMTADHCLVKPVNIPPYFNMRSNIINGIKEKYSSMIIKKGYLTRQGVDTKLDYAILCHKQKKMEYIEFANEDIKPENNPTIYGLGSNNKTHIFEDLKKLGLISAAEFNQIIKHARNYDLHLESKEIPYLKITHFDQDDPFNLIWGTVNNSYIYEGSVKFDLSKVSKAVKSEIITILNDLAVLNLINLTFDISNLDIIEVKGYFTLNIPNYIYKFKSGITSYGDSGAPIIQNNKIIGILVSGFSFWTSVRRYYISLNGQVSTSGSINQNTSVKAIQYLNQYFKGISKSKIMPFNNKSMHNFFKDCTPSCETNTVSEKCKKHSVLQIEL